SGLAALSRGRISRRRRNDHRRAGAADAHRPDARGSVRRGAAVPVALSRTGRAFGALLSRILPSGGRARRRKRSAPLAARLSGRRVLPAPRPPDATGHRRLLRRDQVADVVAARRRRQGGGHQRAAGALWRQPGRYDQRRVRAAGRGQDVGDEENVMALYAFDGTWNAAKTNDDPQLTNTNVVRFHEAYHTHSNANDFYVAGVGTRWDSIGKILGGFFGLGELPRLDEAYDHL